MLPWWLRRSRPLTVRKMIIILIGFTLFGIIIFGTMRTTRSERELQAFYGYGLWLVVGVLSVLINVLFDRARRRVRHRKAKPNDMFYKQGTQNISQSVRYVLGDDGEIVEIAGDEKRSRSTDSKAE
jgi:hypothetical protein